MGQGRARDDDTQPGPRGPGRSRGGDFPPVPAEHADAEHTLIHGQDGGDATQLHGARDEAPKPERDSGGDATLLRETAPAPRKPADAPSSTRSTPTPASTAGREPLRAAAKGAGAAGGVLGGRFEIVRLLGEGGMGKVYEVRDRQIEGRAVALKVLLARFSENEQFRKLFFQEIRAAQKFVNEHVIQVRDTGKWDDGTLFLTMDLLQGESLRALLDREKTLRPRQALEIARQALLGLHSGHEHGFIHRDVKPSNIMLAARIPKTDENPYGVGVRILDFGIAGVAAEVGETTGAGTAMYMSPEQAKGERLDARSDLFAVGVVLYEMLKGARPFAGKTSAEVMDSVIETDVGSKIAEMQEIPTAVRELLDRALQKDREKRFQSALEFAKAIEKSSAYQLPRVMPVWAMAALGGIALVAGSEAALLWRNSNKIEELNDRIYAAGSEREAALRKQDEAHEADLKIERGKIDALTTERDGLRDYRDRREREDREAQTKKATDEQIESIEVKRLNEQVKRLERDLAAATDTNTANSQKIASLEERATKAEKRNETLQQESSPVAKAARGFDAVTTYVENGLGHSARTRVDELERQEGVFAKPDLDGASFVRAIAECADFLQAYQESEGTNLLALRDARLRLERADRAHASFELQASAWLPYKLETDPLPQRTQAARRALDKLHADVDGAWRALDSKRQAEWARIASEAATQDPSVAFTLADAYGNQELLPLAERYLTALRATALRPDGSLSVADLSRAEHLGLWAERVLRGGVPLAADAARDLQWLWCAKRWYDSDETNDDFVLDAAGLAPVTARVTDWRWQLFLQWRFIGARSDQPYRPARLQIQRREVDGQVFWRTDELEGSSSSPNAWTWRRRDWTAQVGWDKSQSVSYERLGKRVVLSNNHDNIVLDAASSDGCAVMPQPPLWRGALPSQLNVTASALEEFHARLARETTPCLVTSSTSKSADGVETKTERWFSPSFGLLREEVTKGDGTQVVRDLVFMSSAN